MEEAEDLTRLEKSLAVDYPDAFGSQALRLFFLVRGHQAPVGAHDAPPRQSLASRQHVSNRSSSPGKARFLSDLSVGRNLSWPECAHGFDDFKLERS